jgi:hypothetical protein
MITGIRDNRDQAKLPDNQSNITLSGLMATFGEVESAGAWRRRGEGI